MTDGYWELEFVPDDNPETVARANALFIQYLHDLRESSPDKFRALILCIRGSNSQKILEKLEAVDLTPPPRKICRGCGGPIDYTSYDWDWNIQAADDGFCGALCQEAQAQAIPTDLIVGITETVSEWLTDQHEYDAFDSVWDDEKQCMVIKLMRGTVR